MLQTDASRHLCEALRVVDKIYFKMALFKHRCIRACPTQAPGWNSLPLPFVPCRSWDFPWRRCVKCRRALQQKTRTPILADRSAWGRARPNDSFGIGDSIERTILIRTRSAQREHHLPCLFALNKENMKAQFGPKKNSD